MRIKNVQEVCNGIMFTADTEPSFERELTAEAT